MVNNQLPKLSVVIPTYNEENYIGALLDSLVNQTYKDFEVIVSDKSTDNTQAVCSAYKDKLNIQIVSPQNKGVSAQRNLGAKTSTSDHLIFFDADVWVEPYFLEKVAQYIVKKDPGLMSGWQYPLEQRITYFIMNMVLDTYLSLRSKFSPIGFGAFLYVKKSNFDKVGGFEEKLSFVEDVSFVKKMHSQLGIKSLILPDLKVYVSTRRIRKEGVAKFAARMLIDAVLVDTLGTHSKLLLKHEPGDAK